MRYRLIWQKALVTVAVTTAIAAALYIAQRSLQMHASHLIASGYDRAGNPDLPTEADWKAMDWEQRRACKQRFTVGMMQREFRSWLLIMLAVLTQFGIAITALTGLGLLAAHCTERRQAPSDATAP